MPARRGWWSSIIRDDLLARVPEKLPVMLDYKLLAESGSLHNTPPCFAIYMVGLVLKWLKDLGGLPAMYKINQQKAALVYNAIDSSGGFYRGHAVAGGPLDHERALPPAE